MERSGTPLVGRAQELARGRAVLERDAPALIVVTGDDGMGKSCFVGALAAEAREAGWAVAHREEPSLRITPSSSPSSLVHDIATLLQVPETRSPGASGLGARSVSHLNALVGALAQRAPAMVLLDGYRPAPEFARWWLGTVIRELRALTVPVVFVISDLRERVDGLLDEADEVIELGPLDRGELDEELRSIGERLEPVMADAERAALVDGVASRPELLDPLRRALELALPGGQVA